MSDVASLKISVNTSEIKTANDQLDKLSKTSGNVEKSTAGVTKSFSMLNSVLTAGAIIGVTAQYIKLADTMTGMTSKLKLVTNSTTELVTAQEELFKIAQKTRQGYAETVDTYSNFAMAMGEMGKSQKEILRVTETVNKAIAISGGTAQQAAAATMQLGQAFASGTLRGDELNSILENSKGLAKAIADGMGVPIGKLRSLGSEGKITAEILANALEKSAASVDEKFGKITPTVESSMTMVTNSIMKMVGDVDQEINGSGGFASIMSDMSSSMDKHSGKVALLAGNMSNEVSTRFNAMGASIGFVSASILFSATSLIEKTVNGWYNAFNWAIYGINRLKGMSEEQATKGTLKLLDVGSAGYKEMMSGYVKEMDAIANKYENYKPNANRLAGEPSDKGGGKKGGAGAELTKEQKDALKKAQKLAEEEAKIQRGYLEGYAELQKDAALEEYNVKLGYEEAYRDFAAQEAIAQYEMEKGQIEDLADRQAQSAIAFYEMTRSEKDKINEENLALYEANAGLFNDEQMQTFFTKWQESIEAIKSNMDFSASIEFDPAGLEGTAKAIAGIGKSMSALNKAEKQYNDNKNKAGVTTEELAKNEEEHNQNQIAGYANMAGAMSAMFEQGSKEAEAFQVIQSGLAVVNAVTAVMNAGTNGDGYTAVARMLAVAATATSFLSQIGKSLSGGGAGSTSATIPNSGTVLGDSSAVSESTTNIVGLLEDIHVSEYAELRDINRAVTSMAQGIQSAVTNIFKTGVLDTSGVSLSSKMNGIETSMIKVDAFFSKLTGGNIGFDPITSFATNMLSKIGLGGSSKQYIAGSGFNIGSGTLGQKASGDIGASTFVDIETAKKNFWGQASYSHNIVTTALDSASSQSISLIYKSFSDTMMAINDGLATDLAPAITGYTIDAIKLNLQGKTGEQAVKELNDAFSALGDKMTSDVFGNILNKYQDLGEGLLETAVRVITEKAVVIQDLGDIGKTVSGDIIGISQSLVDLSGSLGDFQDNIASYYDKYFTDEEKLARSQTKFLELFSDLGIAMPSTSEAFRSIVDALDLNTYSGQETFTSLMSVSDAFYDFSESAKDLATDTDKLKTSLFGNIQTFVDSLSGELSTKDPSVSFYTFTTSFNSMIDSINSGSDNLLDVGNTALENAQSYLNVVTANATASRDIQFAKAMLSNKFSGVIATPDLTLNNINSTLNSNNALLVAELQALKFELNSIKTMTIDQTAVAQSSLVSLRGILGEVSA